MTSTATATSRAGKPGKATTLKGPGLRPDACDGERLDPAQTTAPGETGMNPGLRAHLPWRDRWFRIRPELRPVMIQTWPSSRDRRQDWPGKITGEGDRRSSHVTRSALAGDLARL